MAKQRYKPTHQLYFRDSNGSTVRKLDGTKHPLLSQFLGDNQDEWIGKYNNYVRDRKKPYKEREFKEIPSYTLVPDSWRKMLKEAGLASNVASITVLFEQSNHPVLTLNMGKEVPENG